MRGELLPIGVSHLHNYYWRLDFDLNTDSGADSNDVFEEIEFLRDPSDLTKRQLSVTRFETEAARSMNPQTSRFWRVRDGAARNADNRPISYDILALDTGHRDVGPDFEPFTFNDVYVTAYRGCERFASHNPADASGGCAANEDLSDFVDGQNLVGGDLVVWFGLTFHHIPRDEDENYMHSHWNHFRLSPRDWTAGTLASEVNGAPSIDAVPTQENVVGDAVGLTLAASDPDGDAVTFTAAGLPTGLSIATATGHISGTASTAGNYFPTVTATDTYAAADSVSFLWHVQSASNSNPVVAKPGPH